MGKSTIYAGSFIKLLKDKLLFGNTGRIVTGTDDPSSSATDGERGALYMRDATSLGELFIKNDTGSSTDWTKFPVTVPNKNVSTETTTATIGSTDDVVLASSAGGAYSLTLPAVSAGDIGKVIEIKKTTTDFDAITIDGDGADTIDGSATTAIHTIGETLKIILATATNWEILDRKTRTEVTSFTMIPEGVGSDPTKGTTSIDQAYWWRDGFEMMIRWDFQHSGAGTAGSGNYFFPIPVGVTMDSGRIDVGDNFDSGNCGTLNLNSTTEGRGVGNIVTRNSTDLYFIGTNATSLGAITATLWDFADAALEYSMLARVPITGWNG